MPPSTPRLYASHRQAVPLKQPTTVEILLHRKVLLYRKIPLHAKGGVA
jgi:hypothetical protein